MSRSGHFAVVTGASSGIGAATALTLAAGGYPVAVGARREDRLTDLVQRDIAIRHARDSYDLVQSTRNYVQHLRGVASGRGGEEATLNLTEERARLAREQADGVALKNAKARGELVAAAFADVTSPARLEIVRRSPTVILDAAHNPHGAAATAAGQLP